jgi:hypothetical protein
MENRSLTGINSDGTPPQRTERLHRAFAQLESVLESVDLRHEPELADAVVDALDATDTAIEADRVDEDARSGDRFVFSIRTRERRAPPNRN